MGIASEHELPEKPRPKEEWSFRRLFPLAATVSTFAKTFVNPFDVLLAYLVLIVGIAELLGRRVSWMMWVFAVFILLADLAERHKTEESAPTKEDKK